MKIGVIDADLITRKNHKFPNLACMKISGYHKSQDDRVNLLLDYDQLDQFDKVYISKVFTDTQISSDILTRSNVIHGGTGFYYADAPALPDEIEHMYPDYHLYDDFIEDKISAGDKRSKYKEYLNYSIGFLTRGCFRKCGFCVNQKYNRVTPHSPLSEFLDPERKKICLLDDNFLGYPDWRQLLQDLIDTGKPFKFKQGLDERLLTDEKCEILYKCKYDGDITYAFDKIEDYNLIKNKMELIRKYSDKQSIFYVLCGWDQTGKYTDSFWLQDIINTFERIKLIGAYGNVPYIMRYERYQDSPYRGIYITLARWINQISYFKKQSFYDYVTITDFNTGRKMSSRYLKDFTEKHPEIAERYFHTKYFIKGGSGS